MCDFPSQKWSMTNRLLPSSPICSNIACKTCHGLQKVPLTSWQTKEFARRRYRKSLAITEYVCILHQRLLVLRSPMNSNLSCNNTQPTTLVWVRCS